MIFESHAHYDDRQFDKDRDILLEKLLGKEICNIINIGASLESTKASIALAEKYERIYAAAGVHPSEIHELDEGKFAWLKGQAANPNVVAIGEIGLDYYWEKDPAVQKAQRDWFARQLQLARQMGLPAVIHSRDAAEDTMQVMKEVCAWEIPGVVHCYSYSLELAKEFVRMGYYIGVGGVVTFKNSRKLKETVKQIPLGRILLETDAPYLAPEPHRGKRNHSGYLGLVAAEIARIKEVTPEEVAEITQKNAKELFCL